jgi:hypothetical protein
MSSSTLSIAALSPIVPDSLTVAADSVGGRVFDIAAPKLSPLTEALIVAGCPIQTISGAVTSETVTVDVQEVELPPASVCVTVITFSPTLEQSNVPENGT